MTRVLPTSFKAGRAIVIEGVSYALGATIPNAVVAKIPRVSALLSRAWIIAVPDPHRRRTKESTPRPTALSSTERKKLTSG